MVPRSRLTLALILVSAAAALEFWGGLRANSLALLTDAVHVCMDVFALGIALAALAGAARPATMRKTFGYGRLEILGAMGNGTLLLAVTIFIVYEAVHRLLSPPQPHGGIMATIAAIALVVNVVVGMLLLSPSKANMNVRAALFHVAGDALGAAAVIVGGVLIVVTRAAWIDGALSIFVAGIIVAGVLRVILDAADVLLEGAPRGMNVEEVRCAIAAASGIVAVHDLHVWTIGTGSRALSAHVLLDDRRISEATAILAQIDEILRRRFAITHVTLQFECENCEPDERVVCTQRRDELNLGSKRRGP